MTLVALGNLHTGELEIHTTADPAVLLLAWKGQATERDPNKVLGPYLAQISEKAASGHTVVLDISHMEFMNSASMMQLVNFLRLLSEKSVPTRVLFSDTLNWQRVSHQCMTQLAQMLAGVQIEFAKNA